MTKVSYALNFFVKIKPNKNENINFDTLFKHYNSKFEGNIKNFITFYDDKGDLNFYITFKKKKKISRSNFFNFEQNETSFTTYTNKEGRTTISLSARKKIEQYSQNKIFIWEEQIINNDTKAPATNHNMINHHIINKNNSKKNAIEKIEPEKTWLKDNVVHSFVKNHIRHSTSTQIYFDSAEKRNGIYPNIKRLFSKKYPNKILTELNKPRVVLKIFIQVLEQENIQYKYVKSTHGFTFQNLKIYDI